jgi:uncharacterized protein (DUF433 family)
MKMKFDRITTKPDQMGGEPCIRGMRMPVSTVVRHIAEGWSIEQLLTEWPELEAEDVRQALLFASEATRVRHLPISP